ncbi:MAG: hypothetical protein EOM62_17400 [Bacteroidia bacterium]|nr:hypothetical protein [Bacteroidia bacterium]
MNSNEIQAAQADLQPIRQGNTDPASVAVAEAVKARIQAQFWIALNKPRSYEQSRYRILEACKRPTFAEKVEYRKPVGNTTITGPSIRFAELALREWGNIDYGNTVVFDDESTRRISIIITDLETNTTFSASIQIEKAVERKDCRGREVLAERINTFGQKIYKVRATEDELLMKQAALVSKALRNEGLRLIPQEIIEEAIDIARNTMRTDSTSNIDDARRKISDTFATIGIQPKNLEEYLGHPVSMCAPSEIVDLRAIFNAIKNGEAKWSDFADSEKKEDLLINAKANLDSLKKKISEKTASESETATQKEEK